MGADLVVAAGAQLSGFGVSRYTRSMEIGILRRGYQPVVALGFGVGTRAGLYTQVMWGKKLFPKRTRVWGAEFRKLPDDQRKPVVPRQQ